MMMSKNDITNKEILEAITVFAEATDQRFTKIESEIGSMNQRLTHVESEMVTKDYLDRKLWDLQGDMVAMTRREIERREARFHAV